MFPESNSSQTIIDCLVKEAAKHGVEIMLNRDVQRLRRNENGWELTVRTGREEQLIKADAFCIACGGFPKSSMFDWIRELGHTIVDPVPSLFTFNLSDKKITELMGASSQAIVRIKGAASKSLKEEGPLLFTHWGMSGPVILRLSAWGARELAALDYDFTIGVNWLPDHTEPGLRGQFQEMRHSLATQQIGNKNPFGLPQRFWKYLLADSGINESMRWADLPSKNQNLLIKNLSDGEFTVKGKTTFKEEFVTSGGVELKEIDANTMMSRKQPQLYFAGEILDVDGITGGYNFQHAWTSGYIAARAITGTVLIFQWWMMINYSHRIFCRVEVSPAHNTTL